MTTGRYRDSDNLRKMNDRFEEKLFPPNLAMSPAFAIGRFTAAAQKYGQELVLTDSRFKKAREIRATAAFLLGLSKITEKTYWVMPEYVADTPDTYGISFASHPKYESGKIRDILSIEVTEYETHSDEELLAFVRRKLSNKYLPKHFILLVHVNRLSQKINTEEVFSELSKEKLRLGEVWLLGNVEDPTNDKFVVVCLYSTRAGGFFQLDDEIGKNKEQIDMITMSRGMAQDTSQRLLEIKLPDL
jgi:hypothetical protein